MDFLQFPGDLHVGELGWVPKLLLKSVELEATDPSEDFDPRIFPTCPSLVPFAVGGLVESREGWELICCFPWL